MQVLRMMNVLLDKHPQSRRRGLSFNTLSIIPVWPQVLVCDTELLPIAHKRSYNINGELCKHHVIEST